MFLRSDGTDVSWGTDGSRLTSINASNVSTGTLSTSRGGTGNTFSSASKSDLLVGTSGGTFATLSIPASSANGKVLKINGSNELYWGPDNTSTGVGGGGSGQLSLASTFMNYASGTDYDTSTGETINLNASTTDTANYIVVRDSTKNINVTKVTLGTGTLTETEYSGKSATVTVGTDNGSIARSLAFVDGNSILKDHNNNLAWTPSSKSLRLGPSSGGTSNTLTNILWTGKSSKIAIGNSDTSGDARPVLYGIGEIANKDASDRLNWTPGGTHAGTLTIGTIGGNHSNITSSTFTGTATKVTVTNDDSDTNASTLAIPYVNGTDLDSKAGTFHYQPSTNTVSATTFDGALTGTAAKVTVTNESNPSSDNTARAIPYLNGTILKSVASTFHYKPDTGTVTATKFSGDGSGLSSLDPGELSSAVGSALGGTGQTGYTAGDILYANNDTTPVLVKLAGDNGKFLKSTSTGVEWSPVSASTVPVTTETSQNAEHGLVFVSTDDASSQALEKDMTTLKYNPSIGTLTTSNLITSDTSTNARNGIANTAPTSTLSVGTVVSIQETSTGDVLIVRGNGYFNDDVYIAKKLTLPSGSVLVADTIRVRSHNVKETLVVAERPASQLSV